jgi:hypothetical protein
VSKAGERATIFTRASEREPGFLNFRASERASARQNFALWGIPSKTEFPVETVEFLSDVWVEYANGRCSIRKVIAEYNKHGFHGLKSGINKG